MIRILSLIFFLFVSGGANAVAGGALLNGYCYVSSLAAVDVLYSSYAPSYDFSAQILRVTSKIGDAWFMLNYQMNPAYPNSYGQVVTQTTLPLNIPFALCDPNFDYTAAAAIYTFFFSSVVMLWFAAKNMGVIINSVRNLGERWR